MPCKAEEFHLKPYKSHFDKLNQDTFTINSSTPLLIEPTQSLSLIHTKFYPLPSSKREFKTTPKQCSEDFFSMKLLEIKFKIFLLFSQSP
jgi:hypothetical protein